MTSTEIHNNVEQIIANFSKEEFIFDLLQAYGVSKASITRSKKGDFNLSKNEGEVLYKRKYFSKLKKLNNYCQLLSVSLKMKTLSDNQIGITDYRTETTRFKKWETKVHKRTFWDNEKKDKY